MVVEHVAVCCSRACGSLQHCMACMRHSRAEQQPSQFLNHDDEASVMAADDIYIIIIHVYGVDANPQNASVRAVAVNDIQS